MERFRRCLLLPLVLLACQSLDFCACLSGEGRALLRFRERVVGDPFGALSDWVEGGDGDHCSWFGVECSGDGRVVGLNLKDLALKGNITPEVGKLVHLKSLVLNNNSFYGTIPKEIGELRKLEILDLGHNNLRGPVPSDISHISTLKILILKSNRYIGNIPPELHDLSIRFEHLANEEQLSSKYYFTRNIKTATARRLLQDANKHRGTHVVQNLDNGAPVSSPSPSPVAAPSMAPSRKLSLPASHPFQQINRPPLPHHSNIVKPLSSVKTNSPPTATHDNKHWIIILSVAAGSCFLLALSLTYILCFRTNKVVSVMPWKTGLSGQLQKAFVTGIPSLRRTELEGACEDFSNVVGSLPDCYLYKGTLSSGVEIAVTSSMVSSAKDWSEQDEGQFRSKISVLSKVNHKNFVNLIGYCEEEEPFTRMMVFEYAPNGTLFEHLHIKEADHLDWAARIRIIMGMAYCLEHLHQLNPPLGLQNLNSSSIHLCDDYASKLSDLSFWNKESEADMSFEKSGVMDAQQSTPQANVYKFGIILLEIISGRLPFSEDDGLLVLWASSHLSGKRPLMDMVDATLESFSEDDVTALAEVVKSCIHRDPMKRPTMSEVVAQLREITEMTAEAARPKLSPLWWAELEIISTERNSLH